MQLLPFFGSSLASCTRMNGNSDAEQQKQYVGKFKKIVSLIIIILRVFSLKGRVTTHPTWNSNSPTKQKQKPTLQQLSEPGAYQTLTHQVRQRLQPGGIETDSQSSSCRPIRNDTSAESVLSEEVQRILICSPWTRTSQDLELAYQKLQDYEAFKDFPQDIQRSICKVAWCQRVEAGRVIFKEGKEASSFYLILAGKVRILKKTSESYDDVIQTYKSGGSFGDIAIIKRLPRPTTCVAIETTELLVISKSDYIDLSLRQSRLSYQRDKHFAFCKTVSVLKYWPIAELESQPDNCTVKYFRPNSVIVKDSQKCDWIYIIMTGSCRVVKRFVDSSEFGRSNVHGEAKRAAFSEIHGLQSRRKINRSRTMTEGLTVENTRRKNDAVIERTRVEGSKMKQSQTRTDLQPIGSSLHQTTIPLRKQFLVQLQILQPRDIFGLSSLLHNPEPSIALVSNGADVVIISKEFIVMHMTETIRVKLQRQIMHYPSEEAMRKRIRDHYTWNSFKQSMIHQVKKKQTHY